MPRHGMLVLFCLTFVTVHEPASRVLGFQDERRSEERSESICRRLHHGYSLWVSLHPAQEPGLRSAHWLNRPVSNHCHHHVSDKKD